MALINFACSRNAAFLQLMELTTHFPVRTSARLEHLPLGTVDHDGDLGDVRFGGDEIQEAVHAFHPVQQGLVELDVDQVGPVFHLLPGDGQRPRNRFDDQFLNLGEPVTLVRSPTIRRGLSPRSRTAPGR